MSGAWKADGPSARHAAAELGERLARLVGVLEERTSVRWAYLFGSAARGEPWRDLDVAVFWQPSATGALVVGELSRALAQVSAGVPLDLVDLGAAELLLAARVIREGRLLLDRAPEARKAWELECIRRALDWEPVAARARALRLRARRERRSSG